ncbi:MAG: glycosyltransferase family 4 protein [Candidatus Abyssubacteria bacterium]
MKILFVTIEDVDGARGSSTHIREKVGALRRRGHNVMVLGGCKDVLEFGEFRSVGSCRNDDGAVSYRRLIAVLTRLICSIPKHARKADIIYAMGPVATFAAALTKPLHRTRILSEITSLENEEAKMRESALHAVIAGGAFGLLQRFDAFCSDRIAVITERVKRYYQEHYGVADSRIMVLGVTADPDKFRPLTEPELLDSLRNRLELSEASFVIAFIGNLAPWQDFELLLRAAESVLAEEPDGVFLIIGDGAQRPWLQRETERRSLANRVRLLGSVPHADVPLYINLANVCVAVCKELASGYSPMKLFEYLACGKPVVATRVSGYEVVEEAKAGILVEAKPAAFASALLSLIRDTQLREQYSSNALRYARQHFGWDSVIQDIESVCDFGEK